LLTLRSDLPWEPGAPDPQSPWWLVCFTSRCLQVTGASPF
jgi:hypothetical protein